MGNDESTVGEMPVPWLTIPAMLADNLARYAHRTAIVDGDRRVTYAELDLLMRRTSAGLQALGLGTGDVVAIWAPNSWQWVVGALACWWRGCTVAPIPARGRILDALPILQATRARLLMTSAASSAGDFPSQIASYLRETRASLRQLCPDLRTVVDFADDGNSALADELEVVRFGGFVQGAPTAPAAEVSGEDVSAIMVTSGSTGAAKYVPRRHLQTLRNRWVATRGRGYCMDDRVLVVTEFSHTYGLNGILLNALIFGSTVVIPPTRNPAELAVLIRREEISLVSGPPSLFVALLAEKVDGHSACSALRYAGTGSANVSAALVRDLYAQGLSVVSVGYGMTECDTISSTRLSDSAETIATTVGRPLDGLDIQITDESGAAVASGVEGEIWIRGYMVASAYLGENGQHVAAIDAQGWLHTGDIGRFTTEGNLQILGRKKDVMSIHGYTLYPAEIEALLSRSGMLREVAVVGVSHALAGEISVAFIVPEDTAAFSLKRLRLWARAHIADYKIPGRFLIVESLPLNRNGKVDRLALKHSLSHPEHKDTSQQ